MVHHVLGAFKFQMFRLRCFLLILPHDLHVCVCVCVCVSVCVCVCVRIVCREVEAYFFLILSHSWYVCASLWIVCGKIEMHFDLALSHCWFCCPQRHFWGFDGSSLDVVSVDRPLPEDQMLLRFLGALAQLCCVRESALACTIS